MKILAWLMVTLLVLVALAIALVAFAPASFVLARFEAGSEGGLRFDDVRGTIWTGQAGTVWINDEAIGRVFWEVSPRALLSRSFQADLRVEGPLWQGTGRVWRSGKVLRLTSVEAYGPSDPLVALLEPLNLSPQGRLHFSVQEFEIRNRVPVLLAGRVVWDPAVVSGMRRADLGPLYAEFDTLPDGQLSGILGDSGGPLALDGQFHLSLLGWGVEALLDARNAEVGRVLADVGQPVEGGRRLLAVEGRWLAPAAARTQ